mgnify:CR=1 FL=1
MQKIYTHNWYAPKVDCSSVDLINSNLKSLPKLFDFHVDDRFN